ncbi:hypothetical protein [Planctomicrobium piriforme]|uniref:hypothetical protein n=1 Tax=Planctomicrobium piriforme TaxID=1576369 RepID=UPI00111332ED|nr:hypothetical protein [Planctomicrobium piriforme]
MNLDFSRTIIRKNNFSGMFGEAPPAGFAVSSMPVLNVSAAAIPVNFGAASSSNADLAAAVVRMLGEQRASNASATAAASSTCNDPCGDIKQLQSDVQELKEITVKLSLVVEKLSEGK